jgi:hypothetical protein
MVRLVTTTPASPLEKEYRYYLAHLSEMVEKFDGKVVVIKDQQVIGTFDSDLAAVAETKKRHAPGTFLVHRVHPDDAEQRWTFHSRVSFEPPCAD